MTVEEFRIAKTRYQNTYVLINLTEKRTVKCRLGEVYAGHPDDPRGFTEPYVHVFRIDMGRPDTDAYLMCSEIVDVQAIKL